MRQAGVLAAAGIVALEDMVSRLADDHRHAGRLAEGLARLAGIQVPSVAQRTNIVFFNLTNPHLAAPEWCARLADRGVRMLPTGPDQVRAVTHHHISAGDIDAALAAVAACLPTASATGADSA
jgi:threonine aldolase